MDISQAISAAINEGNVQRVRNIIHAHIVDFNAPEYDNLLWQAIAAKNTEIIELLIRSGCNLAAEDPYEDGEGLTILHDLLQIAANEGDDDLIEEFEQLALLAIEYGANVNARDNDGKSVFELATEVPYQSAIIMQALLSRGARVDNNDYFEMMHDAADAEDADVALPLLVTLNDPSAEIRSQRAVTANVALIMSLDSYNPRAFEKILNYVLDVDQPGADGSTMLVAAARRGIVSAVSLLLDRGADVNKKTQDGILPIYAASKSESPIIIALLTSRGASIYDRNDDGQYPIHAACTSRTVTNLHFLLDLGASLNVSDYNGKYPIHFASENLNPEILHSVLALGISINVFDVSGNCPIPWHNSPTNCIFIKHVALLQAATKTVSANILTIIRNDPQKFHVYQKCCNELQIMRQTTIFENVNLWSLVASNTTKMSMYWGNSDFGREIVQWLPQQYEQFPIYYPQLLSALKISSKKCVAIKRMNNVLEKSFPIAIPHLAIEKITHYVLYEKLMRLELKYYSSLYRKIEEEGLDFLSHV